MAEIQLETINLYDIIILGDGIVTIERKIRINDMDYFLGFKLKYDKNRVLKKFDDSYFDLGDLSILIDFFEKNYDSNIKYDGSISYMNDIIYLYDRFPFVSYIKDVNYDKEGKITQIGYIDKDDIIDYINSNKIELGKWNKNSCVCPMFYN